jgi:hypothetical protein
MYINRHPDSEESAGELATPQTEEVTTESTQTEEENNVSSEADDDYLNFADEESEVSESTDDGTAAPKIDKTVSGAEYEKIVSQLNATQKELEEIKSQLNHPLVQAGIKYAQAQDSGVEIDPAEFIRAEFGVDTNRLSDEDIVREMIKKEATTLGANASKEDIDEEFDIRWNEIQSMGNIRRLAELKKMRDSLGVDSKEKMQSMINAKQADIKKAQDYWAEQVKKVEDTLTEFVQSGRKDYGLKMTFDQKAAEQAKNVIANNYIRYKKDGSVDERHAIEVAIFAADPKLYIKRIEDAATSKAQRESLKMRSSGSLTSPSTVPSTVGKDLPTDPSAWDPKKAVPIGTIKY